MELDWGILGAFIGYFILVLIIGWIFSKKINTLSDYLLADRQNNAWVTAISAQASDMSGWLLMGLPGALFLAGANAAWIGIGLAIGTYVNWLVVARRLRRYSFIAGDSITLPQFFENRFHDKKGLLRVISAIVIFVFFTIYLASGLNASGKLFQLVFPGLEYAPAMLIGLLIVVIYTFMGGFKAVCWTDLFQGLLMFFAIIIVPIVAITTMGGLEKSMEATADFGAGFLNLFQNTDGSPYPVTNIISNLAWGLGYMGMPHILIRFMAAKNDRTIKTSRRIATVWVVFSLFASVLIGIVGRTFFQDPVVGDPNTYAYLSASASNAETIFIELSKTLFPSIIAGIFISAILAAVMSTADSQLLVVASAMSNDIAGKMFKKELTQKQLVTISRYAIVGVSVIAALLALNPNSTIMGLVEYAWGGFGAAFGPVIILAIFWRRMTLSGAVAGMVTGFVTDILWNTFLKASTGIYELLPAFVLALIVIVVVSLCTPPPSKEVTDDFDKMLSNQEVS